MRIGQYALQKSLLGVPAQDDHFQIWLPCPHCRPAQIGSNRSFDERIVGNTFPAAVRHSVQTAMSEASGHRTFEKPTPSMCNTVPAIESF